MSDDRETVAMIRRARRGDSKAIEELYLRTYAPCCRAIGLIVKDYDLACDLASDAWCKVLKYLPRYKFTGRPFHAWVHRIAINECLMFIRRKEIKMADSLDSLLEDTGTPLEIGVFDKRLELAPELMDFRRELAKLPEKFRKIIIQHHVEGQELKDIAKRSRRGISAVKCEVSRGVGRLRAAFA